MTNPHILNILKGIRRTLSAHVIKNGWDTSPVKLNKMCGISSYLVFNKFKELGLKPIFCMNDLHCFIKLDKRIVDLTICQFSERYPLIMFGKTDTYYHTIKYQAKTRSKIKRLFKMWPKEQNPFKQRLPNIGYCLAAVIN